MNKFKNTELSEPQKYDLARKALETRLKVQKDQKVDQVYKIDLDEFWPDKFIRISLTPLYTNFEDIYNLSWRLFNIIDEKEYLEHSYNKPTVT